MNSKIVKDVYKFTIIISIVLSSLSYIIFRDTNISYGLLFGGLLRLAGLNSIIKMVNSIECKNDPKASGSSNYFLRMILYGIVLWILIDLGVNLLALFLGLSIINIVIIVLSYKEKDDGY